MQELLFSIIYYTKQTKNQIFENSNGINALIINYIDSGTESI